MEMAGRGGLRGLERVELGATEGKGEVWRAGLGFPLLEA